MVARIKIRSSLNRSFFYNENKVSEGVAECLLAENFPVDKDKMSKHQKLNVLKKLASLRENLNANTVHISLNFDPSEKLSQETLKEIARVYMDKIGFGNQPFLVYEHLDSGHPHIHLLTTKVDWNGKVINTNFIARDKSEPARKIIEKQFGLVKAEDSIKSQIIQKPISATRISYGKSETKKSIQNVISEVVNNYKFTSLAELNAILKQYNIKADRGAEQSRSFKNNGLYYKIINDEGSAVGVPIKASLFAEKPTLKHLESRFEGNEKARQPYRGRIKNIIDMWLFKNPQAGLSRFTTAMEKEGINVVLRQNEAGILYGITYVDHKTKCVFNGSALGKKYSANAIQEALRIAGKVGENNSVKVPELIDKETTEKVSLSENNYDQTQSEGNILDTLMHAENAGNYIPYEFSGKKKRRKKKKSK